MNKHLLTILLALILLAPLMELEAKGRHHPRHHHPSKSDDIPHGTRAKLEFLIQAVSGINSKIDALELQVGSLPEELVAKLDLLQLAVDSNSSDISLASNGIAEILADIVGIISNLNDKEGRLTELKLTVANLRANLATLESMVGALELRVTLLEQSDPPGSDLTYSGSFTIGVTPAIDSPQGLDWEEFRSNAEGAFTSIEIRNSRGGSVVCSNPDSATDIANALNRHVLGGMTESFSCENRVWNVGTCSAGVELNAGSTPSICACTDDAAVRPLLGTANWGGVGTTCGAPTQTLEVILTR